MAKGPEDRRRGFRSIEGGLAGTPRATPDPVSAHGDSFDFKSIDWVRVHSETARSIVNSFHSDPGRAARDLSVWNVDVDNEELVQTMNDWQNYPDKEDFEKVCAFAREYLRRVEAGIITP